MKTQKRQQLAALGKAVLKRRGDEPHRPLAEQYEPSKMSASLRAAHDELDDAMYVAFGMQADSNSELALQEVLFKHYAKLVGA